MYLPGIVEQVFSSNKWLWS